MANGNSQSLGGHYKSNIWLNVARRIGSVITKGHTTLLFCPITMIDTLVTEINESYKPLYLCWVIPLHGGMQLKSYMHSNKLW